MLAFCDFSNKNSPPSTAAPSTFWLYVHVKLRWRREGCQLWAWRPLNYFTSALSIRHRVAARKYKTLLKTCWDVGGMQKKKESKRRKNFSIMKSIKLNLINIKITEVQRWFFPLVENREARNVEKCLSALWGSACCWLLLQKPSWKHSQKTFSQECLSEENNCRHFLDEC